MCIIGIAPLPASHYPASHVHPPHPNPHHHHRRGLLHTPTRALRTRRRQSAPTHLAQSGTALRCRPKRLAGAVPAHRGGPRRPIATGARLPAGARIARPTHRRPGARPTRRPQRRRNAVPRTRRSASRCGLPGTHPSALGRGRARGTVGDGPTRAALVPAPARHWSITARRRHRVHHRAHGTPGLRARHPALAGRTQRAR